MSVQKVHPASGIRWRAMYRNCDGAAVTKADVSAAHYTIYRLDPSKASARVPVSGHEEVAIPLDDFLDSPAVDADTGKEYVLSTMISAKYTPPFETVGASYEVEVVIFDQNGEPHADSIHVISTTKGN